jgi:dihydroorotase
MDKIVLNSPLDMHLHLRDGEMLKAIGKYSFSQFSGGLVMPNILPPVTTKEDLDGYKNRVLAEIGDEPFKPYMSLFFKKEYKKEFLQSVKDEILVVKLYPSGATTNSEGGVVSIDLDEVGETLQAMEDLGIPLSIHGETLGDSFEREAEFIPTFELIAKNFPKLKVMMEHISDHRTLEILDKYPNLFATVTLHHLTKTRDDLLGGSLNPHLFCKPILKRDIDREAIQKAVFGGHPKIMFGSDSAPHRREAKENGNSSAGVFSAPILLEGLTTLFDNFGKLDLLQNFVSENAKRIYEIDPPKREIILERKEKIVSKEYGGVVPLFAGETLNWSVIND